MFTMDSLLIDIKENKHLHFFHLTSALTLDNFARHIFVADAET